MTLTVTNPGGSSTSPAQTVRVTVPAPKAAFPVPATPRIAGTPITFTNTSEGGPFDTVTWAWDDGTANGSGNTPSHTFAQPGTYRVRLTVTNPGGTDSVRQDVRVWPAVHANFTAPATANSGQNITFANTSTGADSYAWSFSDGATSTATSPSHSFTNTTNAPLPFTVTLTARNAGGSEETVTKTVTVESAAPVADFVYASGGGDTVNFTYRVTPGAGTPASYSWNFGDGSPANTSGPTVSHTYDGDGPYSVTLTVTNSTGSDPHTISISMATPNVDFSVSSASPQRGPEPHVHQHVHRRAVLVGHVVVGRRHRRRERPVRDHRFTAAGTYDVTVTVVNARGSFSQTKDHGRP